MARGSAPEGRLPCAARNLGPAPNSLHSLHSLRSFRSNMRSQARGGSALCARPKSLRCSAPHKSPSNAPCYRALASRTLYPRNRAKHPLRLGSARRRAICARPSAQRSGSGARSALQYLTWRHLFERSELAREASLPPLTRAVSTEGSWLARASPGTMSPAAGRAQVRARAAK